MNTRLCDAIRDCQIIEFQYSGGYRLAEPHCYGVSHENYELLRVYQIGGHSQSGQPVGWKLLRLDQLSHLSLTNTTFTVPRPDYNPEDKAMASIHCQL